MDHPNPSQFDLPVSGFSPVVTKERFSHLSGLAEGVVQGLIEKGHLPSVKIGRHRLVNVIQLVDDCLASAVNL